MAAVMGGLLGLLLVHPLTMLITELFHWHPEEGWWHLHWYAIPDALRHSFGRAHIPNAAAYFILSAMLAVSWRHSNLGYRIVAEDAQRFAAIGREASAILHDINNPLMVIRGFGELVRARIKDAEVVRYCEIIKSNADKVIGLIAEIKTLSQREGKLLLARKPVDLESLIRRAARDLGLQSQLEVESRLANPVPVDEIYFQRAVWNLLKNADEAMQGQFNAKIEISMSGEGDTAIIQVADGGGGIPAAIRKCLFKLGCSHGKEHGTGLGLYVTKRIIDAHGGSIRFADRPGGGTVFTIRLPAEGAASI